MLKTVLICIGVILLCMIASAEVPNVINYQGYLTDSNGDPVDGPMLINFKIYGTETGDDSLWSSGFQEVTIANGLINYQLGLSSPLPDDLFASPVRYLGIKVGTDPEIAPRTAITSTAFAWQALRSDSADYADYAVEAGYAWTSSLANDAQNAENLDGFDGSYYLDWYNLNSIPADFADGIDDVGGGGDITGIFAEGGLDGGGESGEVVLTIADYGVNNIKIASDAVTGEKIPTNAIGSDEIAADAVGISEISTGAVTTDEIFDRTITNNDIANDANILVDKIGGTAMNLTSAQTVTGDKTFSGEFYVGDSSLWVNNYGVVIGTSTGHPQNYMPLQINRDFYDGISFSGFLVDVEKFNVIGDIRGGKITAYSSTSNAYDRYGLDIQSGKSTNALGYSYGINVDADGGTKAYGVYSSASFGNNANYGILAYAGTAASRYGVYGTIGSSSGDYGVYSNGNLHATGTNTKAAGGYKIDHPDDPANMYLSHSDVSSPEMMNIYNGNVELDANGEAVVELPEYFESLNTDFRYQLTPVGASMPNLYVSQKIDVNRFFIAGGKPFMEVSWQVTGIRQDAFAKSKPTDVESMKASDKQGLYQNPEVFGYGIEKSVDYENIKESLNDNANPERE